MSEISATTTHPRRKGRPKSATDADRRRQMIEIASRLFIEDGYQSVTMARIAATARTSLSTLYRLFPGKQDLFAAIVETHRRSMIDLPGDYDALPVAEALGRIFWVDIDADTELWRSQVVNMMVTESQRSPELAPLFHDGGPEHSRRLLADWLEQQRQAGRIDLPDAEIAAKMLMDVAFGLASPKAANDRHWHDDRKRTEYLTACFQMLTTGLLPR